MKTSEVKFPFTYSTKGIILSTLIFLVLFCLPLYLFMSNRINAGIFILGSVINLIGVTTLIFMPISIVVSENKFSILSPFYNRTVKIFEIERIEMVSPEVLDNVVFGSKGFFGYWGWFRSTKFGKFMAFYGSKTEGVLIRLKNGKQYCVGCEKPKELYQTLKTAIYLSHDSEKEECNKLTTNTSNCEYSI